MEYWVYENWVADRGGKARVHIGNCPRVIHRKLNAPETRGRWTQFPNWAAAAEYARSTPRLNVYTELCAFCPK